MIIKVRGIRPMMFPKPVWSQKSPETLVKNKIKSTFPEGLPPDPCYHNLQERGLVISIFFFPPLSQPRENEPCPPGTMILDFSPPELWDNKFVFWAAQFMTLCCGSPSKLIHYPNQQKSGWSNLSLIQDNILTIQITELHTFPGAHPNFHHKLSPFPDWQLWPKLSMYGMPKQRNLLTVLWKYNFITQQRVSHTKCRFILVPTQNICIPVSQLWASQPKCIPHHWLLLINHWVNKW